MKTGFKNYFLPNLQDLTGDKTLAFFGDDHNMNQGRNWLASEISGLVRKQDFVLLEYVETDNQSLLTDFNEEKMADYLKLKYDEFPGFDFGSVIGIVNACKEEGVAVFGIEMPENTFNDWHSPEAQDRRVDYLVKQILSYKDKGSGIVLLGADHVEKRDKSVFARVALEMGEEQPVSVVFIGGKKWTIDTGDYWIRKLELEAEKEDNKDKLFGFKVLNGEYPCDFVLHFPQVEPLKDR